MREIKGDVWDYYDAGHWIVITTNGSIKQNGEAVMGRGVALQARQRFPDLPKLLGGYLSISNSIWSFPDFRLYTFPVKHKWFEKADFSLIEESCRELSARSYYYFKTFPKEVYMVRPGCGNGGLNWKDVKPILEKYLDDRFIVVERN